MSNIKIIVKEFPYSITRKMDMAMDVTDRVQILMNRKGWDDHDLQCAMHWTDEESNDFWQVSNKKAISLERIIHIEDVLGEKIIEVL